MKIKMLSIVMALLMSVAFSTPSAFAVGAREGAASLFLPTTGQAMNGQLQTPKAKIMAAVEFASILTIAILGGAVGGGVTWAGIGPLIANHAWSAYDAYNSAQYKADPMFQEQQMVDAQRTLELSRQRRFEREQAQRSDVRDRITSAGQQAR